MDQPKPYKTSTNTSLDDDDEAIVYASVLTSSFILPMVLNASIELGIFDILNKAGRGAQLSPDEIARHLPARNPDAASVLDRMLRLLASYSLLNCSTQTTDDGKIQRVYRVAPAGKLFVRNFEGGSLAGFLSLSHNQAILDIRYFIKDALLEGGIPFKMAHGVSTFDYIKADPKFSKAFNSAVSYHSSIITKKILANYDGFEGVASIVDVGGGRGTTLSLIISKYPHISGINFDLPQVIKDAPPHKGVEHVGGDMFQQVPTGGDVILLKRTCHNWSDEKCLKLLKNCREALGSTGKVVVVESILSTGANPCLMDKYVSHYDNIMLTQHEGKERTEDEFRALAQESGFSTFRLVCCVCAHWVMEIGN